MLLYNKGVNMKKCKKCEVIKNNEEFNRWYKKTGTVGLRSYCKDCDCEINKKYREENKEKLNNKRRERTGANTRGLIIDPLRKKRNEDVYRSQRKYPEKRAARVFLNSYIKIGKIVRPSECEKCLRKCKVEGHHEDYSKPLEVKWVCKRCHSDIHFKIEKT